MKAGIFVKKIEGFFLSRRVAVALLIVTVALLILSTRFPDITSASSSPFFLVLPLLIFLSTLICTINRLRHRRIKPPQTAAFTTRKRVPFRKAWDWAKIEDYLRGNRWRSIEGEGLLVFHKGAYGFWGSMIFHGGLLLMLVAAVITFVTLFMGELLLTEGKPESLTREGLLRTGREPLWYLRLPEGEITLEKFKAVYEREKFPVDYIATMKVNDAKGERYVNVRVNDPLSLQGVQYTISRYGYAPGFIIKDGQGKILFDGYVSLIITNGREDYFRIPDTELNLYVKFFPDLVMTKEGPASMTPLPKNPHFGLRIEKLMGESGKGKMVKMGNSVDMEGLSITPYDLRHWAYFSVVKDAGKPVLFIAVVLMAVGLITRFVNHEKWIMIRMVQEDGVNLVEVSGYSRYFPALFEGEVERTADEIGREI